MSGAHRVDQGNGGAPDLVLLAPLDGWVTPLAEVPDPVFAEKMMGDGVAIDPTGARLCAPCDGEIILLHAALHAVTIRALCGAEILMHVGLDTVALGGKGFTAHVVKGQKVRAGDPLISFDLDQLAQAARSLITPLIVANSENFAIVTRTENAPIAQGQELMRLRPLASARISSAEAARELRRDLILPLVHGLHARPAARLAGLAKGFTAEIAIVMGEKRANARSAVALMGLGATRHSEITLVASGRDAGEALTALAALLESGMEEIETAPQQRTVTAPSQSADEDMLTGIRAAPGLGLGVAVPLQAAEIAVQETGRGVALESRALRDAIENVKARLGRAVGKGGAEAAILGAHLAFLEDPELIIPAEAGIASGKSAGAAWRDVMDAQIAILKNLRDARLRERIADLEDVKRQILLALGGSAAPARILPPDAILLAEDILPSELAGLDPRRVAGIALAAGGPTSHAAILAASFNIPALVACGKALHAIAEGTPLLLDADKGTLVVAPSLAQRDRARSAIAAAEASREAARETAQESCHTLDGTRVEIDANLGSLEDAVAAVAAGAEGCGLLRTEFLFLGRTSPPGEDEQIEAYRGIAKALDGRPLTIRTLDIGGDKPASYLAFPAEENPALGLRGVRVSLWRPDLLKTQLRAILRGVPAAQCRIMVPMIASLEELRAVRRLLDEARAETDAREPVALGVMVETPAAAITADLLAGEADFLSIGTNDLTQYGLAMDRGHAGLAAQFDALHPAVLRLIAATAEGAARWARPVGVCGGLASDPLAAPILIGLGVRSLSSTASQIAAIKAAIAKITVEECRTLAKAGLAAASASDVRALLLGKGG